MADLDNIPAVDDTLDLATADRGDDIEEVKVEDEVPEVKQEEVEEAAKELDLPERDDKGRFKKEDDEPHIPKSRFDEQIRKERERAEEAARRAEELEKQLGTRQTAQDMERARGHLKEMIKQRNGLLADGELDKATDLDAQIFEFQQQMADYQAEQRAYSAKEMAKEEMRYDTVVAKLEIDYPAINPDSELYDPDVVREIQAVMVGYQQSQRLAPSQALTKATQLILGRAKAEAEAKKPVEDAGVRRKEAAVRKNAETAKKQPASTSEVGLDHDKAGGALDAQAIMRMSQDEFSKLPDSVLAKMRGDTVE